MNIILLGSPGVGKGTYATILSKKYAIPHISTGDIFREAVKKNTELGRKVREFLDKGELVPDNIVIQVVKERLDESDAKKGFLLDGYPRTIPQAETLEKFKKIDKVLNFVAPEKTIMDRISGRRVCRKCGAIYHIINMKPKVDGICDKCCGELYQRSDEKPEVVKIRLKEYNKKTKPLIDYYKKKGLLANINANFSIGEVDKIISQCEIALKK
jgi:adenylate kinase